MPASISVIVLCWNGQAFIQACLDSVLAQSYPAFKVIVVDNASDDQSVAQVHAYGRRVQLVQNDHNAGFAGGNNIGLQRADGDIVVLLNQDVVVQPGWLDAIAETFADPAIGIVGCKALYPDGRTLQHAGAVILSPSGYAKHIGMNESDAGQHDRLIDIDYATGSAFAIHRRVLAVLGGLDENYYPAFYEEVDFCYRARRAGFRIVYQPKAVFYHHLTTSLTGVEHQRSSILHRNRLRFVLSHWDYDRLRAFFEAELEAVKKSADIWDIGPRCQAYSDVHLVCPAIVLKRQTSRYLGEPLTSSQTRSVTASLTQLCEVARSQLIRLMAPMPDHQDPRPLESAMDVVAEATKRLEAQVQLTESPPLSVRWPILGPSITRLYGLWYRLFIRPFLGPALEQQRRNNALFMQALRVMAVMHVLAQKSPAQVSSGGRPAGDADAHRSE